MDLTICCRLRSNATVPHANDSEVEQLFEEVRALANQLSKAHFRRANSSVLRSLETMGAQTVPALAHQWSSSRQNIQILVNRLERLGYVEFTANPAHQRSALVRLTERGKDMLKETGEQEAQFMNGLTSRISKADAASAFEILRGFRAAGCRSPRRRCSRGR